MRLTNYPISWFSVEVLSNSLTVASACAHLHAFSNSPRAASWFGTMMGFMRTPGVIIKCVDSIHSSQEFQGNNTMI